MKALLFLLILSLGAICNAQFIEPKSGNIDVSDLMMTKYEKDTTAGALILFDFGDSKINLDPEEKFQYQFKRHFRIKIFKNSAFKVADIKLKLFKSGNLKEDLRNLNAVTYNLDNGKIVKTKLDNKKIYKGSEDKYDFVNFAFPDVREGSVIELSYIIYSSLLYNFRGWDFQYSYPARVSLYTYEVPKFFEYRESSKGYLNFDLNERKSSQMLLTVKTTATVGRGKVEVPRTAAERVDSKKTTLAIKDVPAFKAEPNTDCNENYIQSIEFELSSINLPDEQPRNFTETWESVNRRMREDEDFGQLLKNDKFLYDTVANICKNKSSEYDKALAVYEYVRKRIKWNGDYRIWAKNGLKKSFTERIGNSAEINLLLTLMLQSAGLNTNPVLFSTRDNGVPVTYFPTITRFNSVLVMVNIGDKIYLLDGTGKHCPFGLLPVNDINGKGRVVNNYDGDDVNLTPTDKYKVYSYYSMTLSEDGKLAGSIISSHDGYAGINVRTQIGAGKSTDDYYRKLQENIKGLTINSFRMADKEDIYKPVTDTIKVEIDDNTELVGDRIMFSPLLFEKVEKNIYTLEERMYPINYNYPISEQYVFSYTIPANFTVESLPQPGTFKMPDNSIIVSYNIKASGNQVMVRYKYEVNKILFLPAEYKDVKNFYDQIVKKHSEQVILKKIS